MIIKLILENLMLSVAIYFIIGFVVSIACVIEDIATEIKRHQEWRLRNNPENPLPVTYNDIRIDIPGAVFCLVLWFVPIIRWSFILFGTSLEVFFNGIKRILFGVAMLFVKNISK